MKGGGGGYQNKQHRAYASRSIHISANKVGEVTSPSNPKKGHATRRKRKHEDCSRDVLTRGKHACCTTPYILRKNVISYGNTEKNTWAKGLTSKTAKADDKREVRL